MAQLKFSNRSKLAKISGLGELQKNLKAIQAAVEKEQVVDLLTSAAFIVKDKAVALAPHDSGKLQESIVATPGKQSKKQYPSAVVKLKSPGAYPYHLAIEYGNRHTAPKPFMRRAAQQSKAEVVERLKSGIKTIIDGAIGAV